MLSESAQSRARVLVVDDEQAQMTALCDSLRDHDYAVTGFTSAQAALASLQPSNYDLLLTDLMMPEMDGIALLRRALALDPELVAIMMTGAGTVTTAVEAMKAGALDYILKPFKLSMILPVLSRALSVRQLRKENAELQRRVQQRTTELEIANRELQVANKELEAFSYSVSHDLRTPLGMVISCADLLHHNHGKQLSAEASELTTFILKSSERMNELISDLLRLSQLGRQPLDISSIDTRALFDEVLLEVRVHYSERAAEVRIGELPACRGDLSLLKQVVTNLLSNAFKYSARQPQPVIEIGCRQADGESVYFVRDNGAGFDMAKAGKLFNAFQRLHLPSEFEGTGVGLSIVQRIIQRHGGRIWAEAEVGKGATFSFTLAPAVKETL
jgi:signal transduction histidine kinase